MAASLKEILESVRSEIIALKERNSLLEGMFKDIKAENESLRHDLENAIKERDRAMLDAEFMAVSHKLADSPDNLILARRKIAGLIRNIDRCLEMMKD